MKNLSLKIWSVLIACAIAYGVHNQSNAGVITLFVPVEVLNLPEKRVILLPKAPQARVSVRGPSFLLSKVASNPPSFQVRLPKELGTRYSAALQPALLNLPPGIEVLSIDPSEFEYVFDTREERELQVVVPRIGQVNQNVKLTSLEIEPRSIKVEGASGELKGLKTIETTPLDLRDISESTEVLLGLRMPGSFTSSTIETVRVLVNVVSLQVERTFEELPIEIRSASGENYLAQPSLISVEVSGPKKLVSKLTQKNIIPYVRINSALEKAARLPVTVELPKGIDLVMTQPEIVLIEPVANSTAGE